MWRPRTNDFCLSASVEEALVCANDEAISRNSTFIRPEDILLGLLREKKNTAALVLLQLGLKLQPLRAAVRRRFQLPDMVTMGKLPLHPYSRRALRRARRPGNPQQPIEASDLLLALIENPRRSVIRVLRELNVQPEAIRALIAPQSAESDNTDRPLPYAAQQRRPGWRRWLRILSGRRG